MKKKKKKKKKKIKSNNKQYLSRLVWGLAGSGHSPDLSPPSKKKKKLYIYI